jgi:trehalose 6-phosphate synthase/phosphatase
MGRLLIVSNRLPVTVKVEEGKLVVERSSGGLATGMRGPHERSDSLWIGWPGDVASLSNDQREELECKLEEIRAAPVYLSQAEIKRYYEGFANGVLWPCFHYLIDKVQLYMGHNWETYVQVNQRFADSVAALYRPDDLIWVHDYHLLLVPSMIRKLIPKARIGFFLHIPFPSADVFRILPPRKQILEGLLGADLVGFHTDNYRRHFRSALIRTLDLEADGDTLSTGGRSVKLGVFPMGIDYEAFGKMAESKEVLAQTKRLKRDLGGRKLILGIDRLDYTKGLSRRLLAIERLLEMEPDLRDAVRLIQVVVPSRGKVESYAYCRRQFNEMVSRINGTFATLDSVPIHYLYHPITENQLVALYRTADVMLVTPLRDGMNLVSKEFAASRTDGDGVLVLSEFAGASVEMAEALHVNPYDVEQTADAIRRALSMPEDQRRDRMTALRRRVKAHDSFRWSKAFMEALAPCGEAPSMETGISTREEIEALVNGLRRAERLILFLDYGGTLLPFASAPELAAPDAELLDLLGKLAARPGAQVHIVSGRTRDRLDHWLGDLPLVLHAENGYWSRRAPDKPWKPLKQEAFGWKRKALPVLEWFTGETPGSMIEDKTAALMWHYRMAEPELGAEKAKELGTMLERELEGMPVEVRMGKKVVEIRTRGRNLGEIVPAIVKGLDERARVVAMGDDSANEELFAALPSGAVAIRVGPGPSLAPYRLAGHEEARDLLRGLLG